jgi:uncharacterized protein
MDKAATAKPARSLTFGIERLGLIVLRFPFVVAILVVAVTIAALAGMARFTVDDSLSELFRTNSADYRDYEVMATRYPSSEYDVLVVVEGTRLLERRSIEALRDLVLELQFVEGMSGLVSLFSAREAPEPGKVPSALFPSELPEGEEYARLIENVRTNEIISGKLLSDDGELALIVVALNRDVVASEGLRSVVGEIDQLAEDTLAGTGLTVQLSGAPVMQLEIRNAVERDRFKYNVTGFLFGVLIAFAFFRRVSLTIIATVPAVIGIVWSLGLFGWLGFKLNLFLNIMTPLIMVLAFSDSMQLTVAMRNRLLEGDSRMEAARYALLVVGPACVMSSVTAFVSFAALIFADSALITTFGIAGALSTIIAFIACITVVPLLSRFLINADTAKFIAGLRAHDYGMDMLKSFCGWIAQKGVTYPKTFLSVGLITVIACGAVYTTLEPRYRLADQVPDREQARAAGERLDAKLTGANPIHVMIDWPQSKTLYDEDILEAIGAIHALVETQSGVGNVWSVETLRRWLEKTGEAKPEILQEYIEILPDFLTQRFIAQEQNSAVVTGRIPDVDIADLLPVIDRLEGQLDTVRANHPDLRIVVTGLSAVAARNSADMIGNLNIGLAIEVLLICAMLGLVFRSIMVVAVSFLPVLFPVVTAGAVLAFSGEGLQFASIVALIVSFGLALNATVHYLNRLRLEYVPGEEPAISVARATVLIGPALVLTTVILAFGLGITVLSDLPSLRLFGRLAAITLVAALIGDLLLLPATVLLARRLTGRWRGSETPAPETARS